MHIFIYLALDYPGNLIMTMVKIDERLRVKSMSFKFSLRKQNNIPVETLGFFVGVFMYHKWHVIHYSHEMVEVY